MAVLAPARPAPYRRTTCSDAELVRRVGRGDREAFAQLYDRTRGLVFRRVLAVVRDRGYAEETCQDVYIQVWRSAAGFDERRGSATTWLRTLAHRQAVDRVRHERASSDHDHAWGVNDYRPPIDSVVEETLRRHDLRSVRTGLTVLTPLQRESVVLAYYRGLTYPQVAAHLGVQVSTVKSRIRAALARLETALAELDS
ncbi:sigma-70 family RNA polymerase sigma factor [Nocardia sp. CDC159]|uniref:Sigma-70 family RNA polymerase sigma factor n=1 Tax=Nocardia pulmonis TaxID=2951408 RepID=A0A9X2E6U7_9NOCA|nr:MULTISPECIES: sigma-70 family RNA polymerase sigma factor [Nocardia]MCM6775319.1 sigma-70 family RNA polymerase sigma factor [Nocardia pulmonis]MCM6787947.1 sigma-70 family RNA polymerase sigma factor [Nocardia sp. CDC159]